jgi:hypothetical protein
MANHRYTGKKSSSAGRWLWWLATRLLLPLALLYGLVWWRIDSAVERQLGPLRQIAQVERGRTYILLDGRIGIGHLRVSGLPGASPTSQLRIGKLEIETPGLWWLLKASAFGVPEQLPRLLAISAINVEVEGALAGPESGFIGSYSAMPMEAAGCETYAFSRSDLQAMGLPASDTMVRLSFEHSDAGVVTFSLQQSTAGVGSMLARLGLALSSPGAVRPEELVSARIVELSLVFSDQGFIEARNGYCTDRVTTSLADFNRVHLDGVQALLRTVGLRPDADLLRAYGVFAARGGELRIETRPGSQATLPRLANMDREGLMQALAPYVRVDGIEPVRFAFARVKPMSLRQQQVAKQIARARLEDGVPLDEELSDVVSDPPRIPAPPQPPPPAIPMPDSFGRIAYADLGPYVGREIEVATIWGSRRRGLLREFAQARLLLDLPPERGGFVLTVPAETVLEVRVLEAPARQPDSSNDLTDAQAN